MPYPTPDRLALDRARAPAPALAARHWRALCLDLAPTDRPWPWPYAAGLWAFHALGILAVVRLSHHPLWLALLPALAILPLLASLRLRRPCPAPESLAPLVVPYAVLALRLAIALAARLQGGAAGPLVVPEPWGRLLDLDLSAACGATWALLAQAGLLVRAYGGRVRWPAFFGGAALALALGWSALAYARVAASGVTASDPYAYVQMAVDLARRGTPLHTFALAPQVAAWGLPTWPAVPVGYNPPNPATGVAATVWPPGHAALLAVGYLLAGEAGLRLVTPLLGLAALLALWLLCGVVLAGWPADRRRLASGVAVLLLATSYLQVRNLAVPMADIPAQLFSTLTVFCALRARGPRPWLFAALTGVCLAAAFAVRYTQVLLVCAVVVLWWPAAGSRWQPWLARLAVAAAAACLAALPVFWYHTVAFGGPLRVGSSELGAFAWHAVPQAVAAVAELFGPAELLFLAPWLVWGALCLWQPAPAGARRAAGGLLAWLLAILVFHLFYAALRGRDVLSVLPVLALWAGAGVADLPGRLAAWGPRPLARRILPLAVCLLTVAALWSRSAGTLALAGGRVYFNTFGYLRAEQRAAFDTLARLTPPAAIVAASLHAGPLGLYAGRDAVRPAYWSVPDWLSFVRHAQAAGRPLYLLFDGDELQDARAALAPAYRLVPVAAVPLPYFSPNGGSDNRQVWLYRLEPAIVPA